MHAPLDRYIWTGIGIHTCIILQETLFISVLFFETIINDVNIIENIDTVHNILII
jgi:hypothetical protein